MGVAVGAVSGSPVLWARDSRVYAPRLPGASGPSSSASIVAGVLARRCAPECASSTASRTSTALAASCSARTSSRYGGYVVHLGTVLHPGRASAGAVLQRGASREHPKPGDSTEIQRRTAWSYLTARRHSRPSTTGGPSRPDRPLSGGSTSPSSPWPPRSAMYWLEQQPDVDSVSIYSTLQRGRVRHPHQRSSRDGSATIKIYRNPLVNWIWIGGRRVRVRQHGWSCGRIPRGPRPRNRSPGRRMKRRGARRSTRTLTRGACSRSPVAASEPTGDRCRRPRLPMARRPAAWPTVPAGPGTIEIQVTRPGGRRARGRPRRSLLYALSPDGTPGPALDHGVTDADGRAFVFDERLRRSERRHLPRGQSAMREVAVRTCGSRFEAGSTRIDVLEIDDRGSDRRPEPPSATVGESPAPVRVARRPALGCRMNELTRAPPTTGSEVVLVPIAELR